MTMRSGYALLFGDDGQEDEQPAGKARCLSVIARNRDWIDTDTIAKRVQMHRRTVARLLREAEREGLLERRNHSRTLAWRMPREEKDDE